MIPSPSMRSPFLPRLEALRGLAALAVAGGHSMLLFAVAKPELHVVRAWTMLVNGHAAVAIFFALSGYVLGLGLHRRPATLWPGAAIFCVRRVLRIYPAVLFCLVGLWLLLQAGTPGGPRPGSNPATFLQFFGTYDAPILWQEMWENLTLQSFTMNAVMWTLRIELLCSACLPFLHAFTLKTSHRAQAGLLAALLLLPLFHVSAADFLPLFIFYLGYLLSVPDGWDWQGALKWLRGYGWAVWLGLLVPVPLSALAQMPGWVQGICAIVEGGCAAAIVGMVIYGRGLVKGGLMALLDLPFSRILGRLSYSFYLIHFPVLFFLLEPIWPLFRGPLPMGGPVLAGLATWWVSTMVALPFAWMLHRIAEVPFIAMGRKVDRWTR